ncbi:LuxR family transcriptional regulator [Pararhizobium sp. A13]|uniref:helix-turn-helix transcriptional regulator n=1 Tax=Pararhizobium sp. A13 TaxID=3133975 RepID=UPI00311B373D
MVTDTEKLATANAMFDFLTETKGAKTKTDILQPLEKAAHIFGFDCFAISGIPLPHERIDPYFMLNAWPDEWFERYVKRNYVHVDPVIYRTKMQDDAFVWSEALKGRKLNREARRVMNEATEFKMNDGYSVPLHSAGGFQAIVTFGAEKVDISQEARGALHIISIYAHNGLKALLTDEATSRHLTSLNITPREREVLQWCAAGKTSSEIADIMGRSPRTIQNEIGNAQKKLNVVNTAQMVAESFRLGILR